MAVIAESVALRPITLQPRSVYPTADMPRGAANIAATIRIGLEEANARKSAEWDFMHAYGPKGIHAIARNLRYGIPSAILRAEIGFSERQANELRFSIKDTPFGRVWQRAMDQIHHHGKSHGKRVEAGTEFLQLASSEIYMPYYARAALGRFGYEHDMNQVVYELLLSDQNFPRLDPKIGHGPGGAAMALAMYKDYSSALGENNSLEKARKISGTLALMILPHDEPDLLKKALGMEKGFGDQDPSVYTDPQELLEAFEDRKLDLFKLRTCDLFTLLHEIKATHAYDTYYGLGETFEQQYANVIDELSHDTSLLIGTVSEKDKRAIQNATLMAVVPDMMDMIIGEHSFLRTLTVSRSRKRDLSWEFLGEQNPITQEELDKFRDKIIPRFGEAFWHDCVRNLNTYPDELRMVITILTESGKGTGSDAHRKIWEAMHIGELLDGTDLEKNNTIRAMMEDYQAQAFLLHDEAMPLLMRGDENEITDYVSRIFDQRREAIRTKPHANGQQLLDTFWREELQKEQDLVMECLRNKPGSNGHIKRYSEEAIDSFKRVSHFVQKAFWITNGLRDGVLKRNSPAGDGEWLWYADGKLHEMHLRYLAGERAIAPTRRYDSTGTIEEVRQIHGIRRSHTLEVSAA